ncbi:hypothetical protein [Curvibacter lanceolatus]|uniref:hypothetical protein n=1 Tax=Curvibacter lanceolatus TaxID=86182 RepID=UPI0012F97F6E|nr:hypothetical protein [Curvibacter lanceolatus]
MNTDPTQNQKGTPMDMNPSDLEAAMHDALVKVAGPMLEEQAEMRAQLRAQRLLLTLLYTDRFRDDLPAFDRLMARLVQLTEEATETLPGGKCTSEAIAAKHRVQRLLSQFHNLVRSHAA